MRRLELDEEPDRDRWMVSYADFITLLFAFFVVLYASSTIDAVKFERVSTGVKEAFADGAAGAQPILFDLLLPGGTGGLAAESDGDRAPQASEADAIAPQFAAVRDELTGSLGALLSPDELEEVVRMQGSPEGFTISLSAGHLFSPGSATLRGEAGPVLDRLGTVLESVAAPIRIEGHTDDAPIRGTKAGDAAGSFESNWELSTARATGVLRYLLEHHRLRPSRLSAAGYAEYRPLLPNDSPEGRAANRRVDLVLLADPAAGYEAPGPEEALGNLLDRLPPIERTR